MNNQIEIKNAVMAAKAGNAQAFTYLYNQTYKNQYYNAYSYTRNEQDAQDILQDAYAKAFSSLGQLAEEEKFNAWLTMIVSRTALNAMKKNRPQLFLDVQGVSDDGEEYEYEFVDENEANNPEVAYTRQENTQMVNELLDSLSPEQRMSIILFHLEGISIKEIASTMECNENTVKSRLNLGRKNLKAACESLEKKGYKLYSFSPILLFLLLFRRDKEAFGLSAGAMKAFAGMQKPYVQPVASATQPMVNSMPATGYGMEPTFERVKRSEKKAIAGAKAGRGVVAKLAIGTAVAAIGIATAIILVHRAKNNEEKETYVAEVTQGGEEYCIDEPENLITPEIEVGTTEENETTPETMTYPEEEADSDTETGTQEEVEEPVDAPVEDYKKAYCDILELHDQDIRNYDWQYEGEREAMPVAFLDITGDSIPELFCLKTNTYYVNSGASEDRVDLYIYSYDEAKGEAVQIYPQTTKMYGFDLSVDYRGEKLYGYCLCQTADGRLILAEYLNAGDEYSSHSEFWYEGNAVERETILYSSQYTNYWGDLVKEYGTNGIQLLSEEEYDEALGAINDNITAVILYNRAYSDMLGGFGADVYAMTMEEAYEFLGGTR